MRRYMNDVLVILMVYIEVTESEVEDQIKIVDLESCCPKQYDGIRSHHSVIPKDGILEMCRISVHNYFTEINIHHQSLFLIVFQ